MTDAHRRPAADLIRDSRALRERCRALHARIPRLSATSLDLRRRRRVLSGKTEDTLLKPRAPADTIPVVVITTPASSLFRP